MLKYDIAVIGSGPAGEKAAVEAASYGVKVVVIEKAEQPGGASVVTGTIPSKAIRETVQYINSLKKTDLSGINISMSNKISIKEIMHRKNVVISDRSHDILHTFQNSGVDYIKGEAFFVSEKEILVQKPDSNAESIQITANKIIIAAGTRPYHPEGVPFDEQYVLDSDSVLNLEEIPKTITIFGGGVIGCEYASIFSKLGSRVYLVDPRGTLLDFIDHELSLSLAYFMQTSGVTLRLGEEYETIEVIDGQVKTTLKSGKIIMSSALLYANGRQGTADQLNLEACGITMNHRNQLDVNEHYQTSTPNIYAVGDIIGFPSLVSTGNEQGRLAAMHAVGQPQKARLENDIPIGIYTIPEIAMVGETEDQLTLKSIPYEVGVCNLNELIRGQMIGVEAGILKLIFHIETHQLLGVHIIGQMASELIHIGQAVIHFGGKLDYFLNRVINFPTLSSAYKVAARDGLSRLNTNLTCSIKR